MWTEMETEIEQTKIDRNKCRNRQKQTSRHAEIMKKTCKQQQKMRKIWENKKIYRQAERQREKKHGCRYKSEENTEEKKYNQTERKKDKKKTLQTHLT